MSAADQERAEWHDVMALADLDPELPEPVRVAGRALALFVIDGRVHATDCHCSHMRARLTDGYVEGDTVECPLHQSRFHIPTGRVLSAPATRDIRTFETREIGGRVFVRMPTGDDEGAERNSRH